MTLEGEDQQREGGACGGLQPVQANSRFSAEKVSIAHCLFQKAQNAAAVLSFCSAPSSNKNLWVPEILEETAAAASSFLLPNGGGLGCVFFVVVLGADGVVILSK